MIHALLIQPDDAGIVIDLHPRLEDIQRTVGGYIEEVSALQGGWHAYCDEEGKRKALPPNPHATSLALVLGWHGGDHILVGPVLFLGDGPYGSEVDVPDAVLDAWRLLQHHG